MEKGGEGEHRLLIDKLHVLESHIGSKTKQSSTVHTHSKKETIFDAQEWLLGRQGLHRNHNVYFHPSTLSLHAANIITLIVR